MSILEGEHIEGVEKNAFHSGLGTVRKVLLAAVPINLSDVEHSLQKGLSLTILGFTIQFLVKIASTL